MLVENTPAEYYNLTNTYFKLKAQTTTWTNGKSKQTTNHM